MDDVNQAGTATKPPRRMFSTAASQGALCGALAGLAFGMQLSLSLPTIRSKPFILWLELNLSTLVFIAACLITVLTFWFVERGEMSNAEDEKSHRGKAWLNRVMLLGAWGVPVSIILRNDLGLTSLPRVIEVFFAIAAVCLAVITLSMPVYILGVPGFRSRSSARVLVWTLVCVTSVCLCVAILDESSRANRHEGLGVQAGVLLSLQVCQFLLAASLCGNSSCAFLLRCLSVLAAGVVFVLVSAPVFVYLPKGRYEGFGYPEMAVIVLGYPLMGFVTWGLMDWFAKRAAGEKRQIADS